LQNIAPESNEETKLRIVQEGQRRSGATIYKHVFALQG